MCDPCCSPCFDSCCEPCCSPCAGGPCCPPKRCKSRELRGGVLYSKCDCVKRNGLQYDCPRAMCQGQSCCMTRPYPACCPSKYMCRFSNRTMGKPTNPPPPRSCTISSSGIGCNPCAVKCVSCPSPCDPCCPSDCSPCQDSCCPPTGYSPCCDDPCGYCVGPCGPATACLPCYPSC